MTALLGSVAALGMLIALFGAAELARRRRWARTFRRLWNRWMNQPHAEAASTLDAPPGSRVWRIEVHPADASDDPAGGQLLADAEQQNLADGLRAVRTSRVYLIEGELTRAQVDRIAAELLADPVNQRPRLGAAPAPEDAATVEVHHLPGVMDPVALSAEQAIAELLEADSEPTPPQAASPKPQAPLQVRTGWRYDFVGCDAQRARSIAERLLANPVIHEIADGPRWPRRFTAGSPYEFELVTASIRDLDDDGLQRLSRDGHLFLSLEEMRAIRDYYREAQREPTDVELETLAQTWSEHCVHKTLKSTVRYRQRGGGGEETSDTAHPTSGIGFAGRPGHTVHDDGTVVIENLLASTVAAATNELIEEGVDWCVSVFVDNAGIVQFDEEHAVTFKVETHNHPSAIEPYGGAATGIGGCIRDTIGTGLAAKPIANTDVFAVAEPNFPADDLPAGVLHPRRILTQVVAGVRDYGNRMGIPTVNGAVSFDDRYLGNPLVFCGSVGLIPNDKCFGEPRDGDRIIALGGRTGRDGIHGATFSSAELTDTHAEEFSHAVQIGNPITEKKLLDVILQARDAEGGPLLSAITDCGAGGFSSAVGEMGEKLGVEVDLEQAPLKYEGLSYTEIWISEAQERMVLAVPPAKKDALLDLCAAEDVEACDLGRFGTDGRELILRYEGHEVGRLGMAFLHEGLPQPHREAVWEGGAAAPARGRAGSGRIDAEDYAAVLRALLSHPNIASKHWIIRQYDHEVQGGSVVKPLVGAEDDGPSDAAVVRPKLSSDRAVALSCGLATPLGDVDPYWMALAAIDEAVRNAVCVGARPDRIAILDNFCWADCSKPENLGQLVRAAEACYDGAKAYRAPFISGKDSLNNQFTTEEGRTIAAPPTLLISALGLVEDASRCVTMDAKASGNLLVQVGRTTPRMGRSHYRTVADAPDGADIPRVDLEHAPGQLAAVAELIGQGAVRSAHDCSEGGLAVAAAEMAMAGRLGLEVDLTGVPRHGQLPDEAACFAETPSRILLEVAPERFDSVARHLRQREIPFGHVGTLNDSGALTIRSEHGRLAEAGLDELLAAWRKPLDW